MVEVASRFGSMDRPARYPALPHIVTALSRGVGHGEARDDAIAATEHHLLVEDLAVALSAERKPRLPTRGLGHWEASIRLSSQIVLIGGR
jgi:hypothetical protein